VTEKDSERRVREEHTHCAVANLWPDFFSVDRDGSAHVDRVGISRGRWSDRVWFGIRDEEDARSRYHGRGRAKKGKGTKHRKLLLYVAVEVLIKPSLSLIATSSYLAKIVEGGGLKQRRQIGWRRGGGRRFGSILMQGRVPACIRGILDSRLSSCERRAYSELSEFLSEWINRTRKVVSDGEA